MVQENTPNKITDTGKAKLSPEEIETNKENARQMMRDLINPPPQLPAGLGVGGVPKLKAFIESMSPTKPPSQIPPSTGGTPPLPGLPTSPKPEGGLTNVGETL